MRSTVATALALLAASGCALVEPLFDRGVYVELEIQNRTLDVLTFEDADGQVVEVPACDRAQVASFRVDTVTVRAPDGFVRGFGMGAPEFGGQRMHLVEVASAQDSGIPELGPAPANLPPCEGHAEAQPGT